MTDDFNFDVTTRHREQRCLHCGKKLDSASGSASPEPGDISICIGCGGVLIFGDDCLMRLPTAKEEADALSDDRVQQIRIALREVKARSN
jgi:hypothetical protein